MLDPHLTIYNNTIMSVQSWFIANILLTSMDYIISVINVCHINMYLDMVFVIKI